MKTIKVGQRIRFDTHSNLGIVEDTVRVIFDQVVPGYPALDSGERGPAVTLAQHSWCWVSDIIEVIETDFVMFCKRTEDPKLAWIEKKLDEAGIPHRRNGYSWHAPILEVPEERLEDADAILRPVDDVPDDDPMWTEPPTDEIAALAAKETP